MIDGNPAARPFIPHFKMKHFANDQEFNEYVSSPDYKISDDYPGICFGMQQFVDEGDKTGWDSNNFTFNFHFPDQRVALDRLSYA